MSIHYKVSEFAKLVGVSVSTLRRWDRSGVLKAARTITNRLYYTDRHLALVKFGTHQKWVIGNPLQDGFHAIKPGTQSDTLCGYVIPVDASVIMVEGEPTCAECQRLLAEKDKR